MSYKTILVNLNTEKYAPNVLKVATTLAARSGAHLIGLYVVPVIEIYPAVSVYVPAETLSQHKAYYREEAARIGEVFNKTVKSEDLSGEWRVAEARSPGISSTVSEHAQTADLVIVSQADDRADDYSIRDIPWQVMMETGRPVIIVPYSGAGKTIGKNVMIGWNGTRESARATFDALPILEEADEVHIHWANPPKYEDGGDTLQGTEIAAALARHGVKVETKSSHNPDLADGDVLLSYAARTGADLMVMGGYGHSRAREMVFGGTTRRILSHMTIPVLISH